MTNAFILKELNGYSVQGGKPFPVSGAITFRNFNYARETVSPCAIEPVFPTTFETTNFSELQINHFTVKVPFRNFHHEDIRIVNTDNTLTGETLYSAHQAFPTTDKIFLTTRDKILVAVAFTPYFRTEREAKLIAQRPVIYSSVVE